MGKGSSHWDYAVVRTSLAENGQHGVREARSEVAGGIDGVAGESAEAHADGHDDAEHQNVVHAAGHVGHLIEAQNGEDEHEGADDFTEHVAETVGNRRRGAEHAALDVGIVGGVELVLEQRIHEARADKGSGHLRDAVAGHHAPAEIAARSERHGERGIEVRAGRRAEGERRKHDRQTPGKGYLHGSGALHAGSVQIDVGHNAVTEKNQNHCSKKFSKIRHKKLTNSVSG